MILSIKECVMDDEHKSLVYALETLSKQLVTVKCDYEK